MKRIPKRYVHLLVFSSLILLSFFIIAGSFIISHQRNLLLNNEKHHATLELDLISGFVQESFIKKDFANVNKFLQDWVKQRPYVVQMTATSKNGFKFFRYASETMQDKSSFIIDKKVQFPPNNEIYLTVKHDLTPIERIVKKLNWQLLITFSVIVVFLGIILSFTLTKFAFMPLEREIRRRMGEVRTAHEDLKKMNRQHQLILDSVGDGICGLSSEGYVTFINPAAAKILETPAKYLIGKHYLTATSHAKADRSFYNKASCPVCNAVRQGVVHRADDEFILTPSGKLLPVEYISTPLIKHIEAEHKEVLGAVVVFRDITKQKEAATTLRLARDAAEQANRTKNQFLANISHELRTPLNAIIGYSEILYEDTNDDGYEDFAEYSHNILTAGQQLLSLIDDVLDIAKIETGKMSLNIEQVNLEKLLHDVITTVQPLIQKNNNTLDVKYHTHIKMLETDIVKLRQILLNLLNNAAKFTHAGKITVTLNTEIQQGQNYLHLYIQDNGIGMDEEQQANLFKAFQQADNSSTREYGGMGLGLTLTKEFVEMLEGHITVKSQLGEGSCFCVKLTLPN